jgi:precorrin-6B methylase 1
MSYERMEAAAANAVESIKQALDEKHTVIVMVSDDKGGWSVRWSYAHPLIAVGLAKLGLTSLEALAVKKDELKPAAS